MRTQNQRRLIFVAGFTVYFTLLWVLWPTLAVYPLKIFVVFLHELSHALAGVATGGHVDRITLSPQEGGATYVSGGIAFITLSTGYPGSLVWGLLLLLAADARPARARLVMSLLACTMLFATVMLVRSLFGFAFGLLFGFSLLLASRRLSAGGVRMSLTVLGLTSALYAVLDIRDDVLARPAMESDANMLAHMTGVPTVVWGVLWISVALVACYMVMRKLYARV